MSISAEWIHSTRSSRLLSIMILSSPLYVCVIKVVSLFRFFLSQPCMLIYFLSHVTWPAHHTHLSSMILIILGEEGTLRNSALCNFLHPCHFLLLRLKCFPQYPVLKHLSLEKKFHRRIFIYYCSVCKDSFICFQFTLTVFMSSVFFPSSL